MRLFFSTYIRSQWWHVSDRLKFYQNLHSNKCFPLSNSTNLGRPQNIPFSNAPQDIEGATKIRIGKNNLFSSLHWFKKTNQPLHLFRSLRSFGKGQQWKGDKRSKLEITRIFLLLSKQMKSTYNTIHILAVWGLTRVQHVPIVAKALRPNFTQYWACNNYLV